MTPELTAALVGLVLALTGLVKLWTELVKLKKDRMETSTRRDADSAQLHDKVLAHDFLIAQIKDNQALHATVVDDLRDELGTLNTNVVKLTVVVETLADNMKELKNEKTKS